MKRGKEVEGREWKAVKERKEGEGRCREERKLKEENGRGGKEVDQQVYLTSSRTRLSRLGGGCWNSTNRNEASPHGERCDCTPNRETAAKKSVFRFALHGFVFVRYFRARVLAWTGFELITKEMQFYSNIISKSWRI